MLISRLEEQKTLHDAYESEYSEFVAVYGRRRVGKTFLIRETFDYKFTFTHTGLARKKTRQQLQAFQISLRNQGLKKAPLPANWLEAFDMLATLIKQSKNKRKLIFIDELPWMDAPRSSFVMALEHFWNGFASARRDVVLIVCGSATSWIIKNIVRNKGGLHNRLTRQIYLEQFNLCECEKYAKSLRLGMTRKQIVEAYMILGGVPYYWSLLDKSKSFSQNVDDLFFRRKGALKNEYSELYASLFNHPEPYMAVIEALGQKKVGMTRAEIIAESHLPDNGRLGTYLDDLENCGFIRKYQSIGKKTKNALYQLLDMYTLFYFKFIKDKSGNDEHFWSKVMGRPVYNTWCGLAFERICLLHSRQIKDKLGISGVITSEYSWTAEKTDEHPGTQIDLLIDRSDDTIDLCEMKYSKEPFAISQAYDEKLQIRRAIFMSETKTRKAVHIALVSYAGLVRNAYSDDIQNQVTAEDLFKDIPT